MTCARWRGPGTARSGPGPARSSGARRRGSASCCRCRVRSRSLVAPGRQLDVLVDERFLVQLRRLLIALVPPGRHVRVLRVITLGLAIRRLVLGPEVPAARLVALEGVPAEELGELEEVADPVRLLQLRVELGAAPEDLDVAPVLLAQRRDLGERALQALLVAGHAALVPHD